MKKINLAVCYDIMDNLKPFEEEEPYDREALMQAYSHLFLTGKKHSMSLYFTSFLWYDKKKKAFRKGFIFDENAGWIKSGSFSPDYIFDRTVYEEEYIQWKRYFSRKQMIVNSFQLEELCSDKLKAYRKFSDITPMTLPVKNIKELENGLKRISSHKLVIKPRFGSMGAGVRIIGRKHAKRIKPGKDMLLQQFVESAPLDRFGKEIGASDLRIVLLNGKIIDSYRRLARKGSLISNTAQGGRIAAVRTIPKDALALARQIDFRLKDYQPRFYSCDFIIDTSGRIWLIEMNSRPSFFTLGEYASVKRQERFEKAFFGAVKRAVKNAA